MKNLRITFAQSAYISMMVFDVVFTVIGLILFGDLFQAIIFALLAGSIHWTGELLHNIGHSIAARYVGYPMSGIRFIGPLAASIYPKDEGELPPAIHIKRALGGPLFSGLVATVYLLMLILTGAEGLFGVLLLFGVLDGYGIFTFGALTPLKTYFGAPFESDGDTILKYRKVLNT
jgi:hypothetical protein